MDSPVLYKADTSVSFRISRKTGGTGQPAMTLASRKGYVSLIGAGPGDADLLTLRAARRLAEAEVVIYDHLVGDGVLDLVPAGCERVYVGKESANHTLPQEDISRLLLAHALLGKRVVRLKGGDPFVFGRGGEELQLLAAAGIAVEVVPGITAALGASAATGIPLTHRDYAQSCVFVTGHRKEGALEQDWRTLARPQQTLVIYMGMGALSTIVNRLTSHGRAAATPAALIRNATLPDQQVVVGMLGELDTLASRHAVKAPALIIIGEVVALYDPALAASLAQATARADGH